MPTTADIVSAQQISTETGFKLRLKPWESIGKITRTEVQLVVIVDTYEVQELVREDRYKAKGQRMLWWVRQNKRWILEHDMTDWDDEFVPFVYEKVGRRDTADEFLARREWEKLCARPGTSKNPLDSYERVLGGYTTKDMERYY